MVAPVGWERWEAFVIGVLIAEDNPLVREGLVGLLETTGDITVVAQCEDGDEVLDAALRTRPDVVVMDVVMPRLSGLEATRILMTAWPGAKVLVLTGTFSAAVVREAHSLGACGYVLKGGDPDDLFQAIRTVANGGTAWSRPALACLDAG